MSLLKKTVITKCSGDKNPQCPNFIKQTPLSNEARLCPEINCGSSVIKSNTHNIATILSLIITLAISGGVVYLLWQSLVKKISSPVVSPIPTDSSALPSVSQNPSPISTQPTSPTPNATSTPKSTTKPPEKLPPPPPSINEIKNAISKLKKMNPNERLEFPVEGDDNYRVVGFQDENGKPIGWNVRAVNNFLEDSLQRNGKFPPTSQIRLIVRNKSTNQRLILKPISKNNPLGHLVRSLNAM